MSFMNFEDVNYWTNSDFTWSNNVFSIMKQVFGYNEYFENQKGIINATISNRDVFACMPTGGGKSLTFQLPALFEKGATIVIMPLIALIHDQTQQMEQKNVPILNLSGSLGILTDGEFEGILDMYASQCLKAPKIIYLTPEKIVKSEKTMNFLQNLYKRGLIRRFVIDEAHCVSQWGRCFRKDYRNLKILKEEFPDICILACTATATDEVRLDIIEQLLMKNTLYFRSSYNRKNLIFQVQKKSNRAVAVSDIIRFIHDCYPSKCGIIYTTTVKECENISSTINKNKSMKTAYYHGQMSENERKETQNKWMSGDINIIVATNAFGMGINKSDVRFVIHYNFPQSICNYYQEAGRAGRDGKTAHCIIFYKYSDKMLLDTLIFYKNKTNREFQKDDNWEVINMVKYCEDQFVCRRVMISNYFNDIVSPEDCKQTCDNCQAARIAINMDLTEIAKTIVLFLLEHQKRKFYNNCSMTQLINHLSDKTQTNNTNRYCSKKTLKIIIKDLLHRKILYQTQKATNWNHTGSNPYPLHFSLIHLDTFKANAVLQGKERIIIQACTKNKLMLNCVEEIANYDKTANNSEDNDDEEDDNVDEEDDNVDEEDDNVDEEDDNVDDEEILEPHPSKKVFTEDNHKATYDKLMLNRVEQNKCDKAANNSDSFEHRMIAEKKEEDNHTYFQNLTNEIDNINAENDSISDQIKQLANDHYKHRRNVQNLLDAKSLLVNEYKHILKDKKDEVTRKRDMLLEKKHNTEAENNTMKKTESMILLEIQEIKKYIATYK